MNIDTNIDKLHFILNIITVLLALCLVILAFIIHEYQWLRGFVVGAIVIDAIKRLINRKGE